ncbi:hypothetical protein BC830DRAFT_1175158 [Chytriomyces sp. MP71]|nr:hypothetical protein BC830DRAFT_1175158 [Chytriomyces sp. MP71]
MAFKISNANNFPPLTPEQLQGYLQRIEFVRNESPLQPSLSVLNQILKCHASTIPYENTTVFLGQGTGSLNVTEVYTKMASDGRAGYCYQNNILLIASLRAIGFNVSPSAVRNMFWNAELKVWDFFPFIHMVALVFFEAGTTFLADMGQHRLPFAMRIHDGETACSAAGEAVQIRKAGVINEEDYFLCVKRAFWARLADGVDPHGDLFSPQFCFSLQRNRPTDFDVPNFYVSKSPCHRFSDTLIISMMTETGGRRNMVNNIFRRREAQPDGGQRETKVVITSMEEFLRIMKEEFCLTLTQHEVDVVRSMKWF